MSDKIYKLKDFKTSYTKELAKLKVNAPSKDVSLDFTDVTEEELFKEASDSLKIKLQGIWRNEASEKDFNSTVASCNGTTIKVRELLDRARTVRARGETMADFVKRLYEAGLSDDAVREAVIAESLKYKPS